MKHSNFFQCCDLPHFDAPSFTGIGKKLHGFVERTARACAAAGEVEGSSASSSHASILHPVEEFLHALVNPAGVSLSSCSFSRCPAALSVRATLCRVTLCLYQSTVVSLCAGSNRAASAVFSALVFAAGYC